MTNHIEEIKKICAGTFSHYSHGELMKRIRTIEHHIYEHEKEGLIKPITRAPETKSLSEKYADVRYGDFLEEGE